MTFAYVSASDLPLQVERRRQPAWRRRPLVVLSRLAEPTAAQPWRSGGRQVVEAASDEARQAGIRAGLTRHQAEHLCPEAVLVTADQAAYRRAFAALVAALRGCSPIVRAERPAWGVDLDASGLELLFGPDPVLAVELGRRAARAGLRVRVGLGVNRLVAKLAASVAAPGQPVVVAPSETGAFLAPLPLAHLPLSDESRERLELLGVRSFGRLLALPRAGLARQVGPDALALVRAAAAEGELLAPDRTESWLSAEAEPDWPIETRQQLEQLVRPLVERLAAQLRWRYLGARLVRLRLTWRSGERTERLLHLPTATQSVETLVEALVELAIRQESAARPLAPELARQRSGWQPRPPDAGRPRSDFREPEADPWLAAQPAALRVALGALEPLRGRQVGLFEGQRSRRAQAARAVQELADKFRGQLQAPAFGPGA
jgi:nucleotidyltransferase/DNA polymerase involved in DNA repair